MKRTLTLALFLATMPILASAQPQPQAPATPEVVAPATAATAPATEAPRKKRDGEVRINTGEGGTKTSNYDTGISELNGDVVMTQDGEDFILYAQKVINSDPKKQATATGQLRVETRDSTIRAARMFADFNTKIISMIDSVVISSYDEGDGIQTEGQIKERAKKKRKPVRIACDRLDWNYDTQQAILVGNIRIVQGDSSGTCNQIIYDEPINAARLLGDVKFGNDKRQRFLTDELVLFVDSGQTQTNAGVRLVGPVNNVADDKDKPAPKPTKPAETFPKPAAIGDDNTFPAPPPDIDRFLPKPGVPAAPGKNPEKPTPATKTEPETAVPAVKTEPETTAPAVKIEPETPTPPAKEETGTPA